jgi:hypothetical protein
MPKVKKSTTILNGTIPVFEEQCRTVAAAQHGRMEAAEYRHAMFDLLCVKTGLLPANPLSNMRDWRSELLNEGQRWVYSALKRPTSMNTWAYNRFGSIEHE